LNRIMSMICLVFVLIFLCFLAILPLPDYPYEDGQAMIIKGKIVNRECIDGQTIIYLSSVVLMDENTFFQIENISNIFSGDKLNTEVKVYLQTQKEVVVGQTVFVSGQFANFSKATNPGQFDTRDYQASLGIGFMLKEAKILYYNEEVDLLKEALYGLKEKFLNVYSSLGKPYDEILKTVILNEKQGMDKSIKNLYQRNGIAHLLSISGLHITFLGMCLFASMKVCKVPLPINFIVCLIVLVFYGNMIHASYSTMRAMIMFLIGIMAKIRGRTYDLLTAISFSSMVILFFNPKVLLNTGVQLSYFAVLGIGILNPLCQEVILKLFRESGAEKTKSICEAFRAERGKSVCVSVGAERLALRKEDAGNERQQSWQRDLLRIIIRKYIAEPFCISLSVTAFTLPIILNTYYEYPIYSVVLNLVVVPLMSFLLISGVLGGIFGLISMKAAELFFYPAIWILDFYEWICKMIEKLPGAVMITGKPAVWQIIVYYVLLVVFIVLFYRNRDKREERQKTVDRRVGFSEIQQVKKGFWKWEISNSMVDVGKLCIAVFMLLLILILPTQVERMFRNRITVLDVGQGDGICIELNGKTILVDGGSSSVSALGEYRLEPFLKSQGIRVVDYIFITHSDKDHLSGVEEMLFNSSSNNLCFKALVLTEYAKEHGEEYETLLAAAKESGCQIYYMRKGDSLLLTGKSQLSCLWPERDAEFTDVNDSSMVLLLEHKGQKALFTGDISMTVEKALIKELYKVNNCGITLLKVAHHGSKYSSGEEFLKCVKPQIAIISCGENNSYGHPHGETLERFRDEEMLFLTTPEYGAVIVDFGKPVKIRGWLQGKSCFI